MHKIIDLTLEHEGIVFGGYLRDMISGDEPSDIDIMFSRFSDYQCFLQELFQMAYCKIEDRTVKEGEREKIGYTINGRFYRIHFSAADLSHTGVSYIDVVIPTGSGDFLPDADVNQLALTPAGLKIRSMVNGYLCSCGEEELDLFTVIDNIHKKQVKFFDLCPQSRREKMLCMGYVDVAILSYREDKPDEESPDPYLQEQLQKGDIIEIEIIGEIIEIAAPKRRR